LSRPGHIDEVFKQIHIRTTSGKFVDEDIEKLM